MPIFIEMLDFGAMFDFRDFQKGTFLGYHFRSKRLKRRGSSSGSERPCSDPFFHQTIAITLLLDLLVFKTLFLDSRLTYFRFLFLCVLFSTQHFDHQFHNTTVNVEPLNPQIFEKIAP